MSLKCNVQVLLDEEQKKENCEFILKLMRSIYFLAKNRIPHSTTYKELIELQVLVMNCLKSILVKGHLMLNTYQDSVLGCLLKLLIFGSKESLCVVSKKVPTFSY